MIGFTVSNCILDAISYVPMCGNGLISFVLARNKVKIKHLSSVPMCILGR